MTVMIEISPEIEGRLQAQAREHGVSLTDYLQQIVARQVGLPFPTPPAREKNLSDLLLNSPFAGSDLNLDRYHDFPRQIDLE